MKITKYFAWVLVALVYVGCADESLAPILTFDAAGKGAYVARVSETARFINLLDVANARYTYSVEFVDLEQGGTVAEYAIDVRYVDNNPANGNKSGGPLRLRSFNSSQFQDNARGYKSVSDITITASELFSLFGTDASEVLAGDQFVVIGTVTTRDGAVFGFSNSSSSVNGAAFRGHFNFTLVCGCPSNLEGTFAYVGSDYWCGNPGSSGTVDIRRTSGTTFSFTDWSFGAYQACYGGGSSNWGALAFTDVCGVVGFTGFVDSFGDTWTFESSIDGAEWTIVWSNTYDEAGKVVLTHPSGAWPFTLR